MNELSNPCRDCGLCCRKLIIEIDHVDVVREPRLLPVVTKLDCGLLDDDEDELWSQQYRLSPQIGRRACPMLDDGSCQCSIYATRPNTCVMFEVGGDHCNELRHEAGLPIIGNWSPDDEGLQ